MSETTTLQAFRDAVLFSRVLSSEQKEFLLDDPLAFPEAYRNEVVRLLTTFDERSKIREAYLSKKLKALYGEFERKIRAEHMDEHNTRTLIQQAKKQIDQFFPTASE